jgi:hypothetical protein
MNRPLPAIYVVTLLNPGKVTNFPRVVKILELVHDNNNLDYFLFSIDFS